MPRPIQNLTGHDSSHIQNIRKSDFKNTQNHQVSKKMKIPSIFKNIKEEKQAWQWPSCKHPKTLSFRACNDDVFTTVLDSVFPDVETPELLLANSLEYASFSSGEFSEQKQSLEMVISGVRSSGRLFFEPDETSSIMKGAKTADGVFPFKDSVALAVESDDPYLDFKKSMQEMVESQGLMKDWDCLEELLGCYLRMNGKVNHGFIVGAFVDVLIGLAASSSSSSSSSKKMTISCSDPTTYSSASSSFSSPSSPLSPTVVKGHEAETDEEADVNIKS
ncbi:hypothetical protein Pfo_027310 [Paulownia fortunei]|nr:hypothetical protein Pfo_027310 [Paulownia fortunei]